MRYNKYSNKKITPKNEKIIRLKKKSNKKMSSKNLQKISRKITKD